MFATKRIPTGVAGLLTAAMSAGILLAGGGAANAAPTTPPWEPDPSAVGTITFYDATGNVITGGPAGNHPFAKYAVGSSTVRAGDVQAVVKAANPDPSKSPNAWFVDTLGGFTPYPLSTGPSAIQALSQTQPVATGASSDLSLDDFRGEVTHFTGTGYTNMVQLRLVTANGAGNQAGGYDVADILVDPTTDTWTQVYPAPLTATTTTLTASPSPASVGQTVTLTATETPAVAGSVQFKDGASNLGSPVVVNGSGVATTTTSTLIQGNHNLSAVFAPTDTATYAGSTGTTSETINPAATPTTTTLAVSQDGIAGDDATLTATVTGPGSTSNNAGSVKFYDNGSTTALGTVAGTTGGTYTLDLPTGFAAGGHSIVAKFTPTDLTQFQVSQSAPQGFLTQAPVQGACAQTGSVCTDTQNIQATIPVGTLVISTPYTSSNPLDLGTLTLNAGATKFSGNATFDSITVTDARSGGLGYTVSALAGALSDGGTHANSTINAENLGLTNLSATPGNAFIGTITPTNNPAADPPVAPGDTGSLGLGGGTPHTVFTADKGLGTVSVKGTLTLNAPTSTEAGLFTGTITFTVG